MELSQSIIFFDVSIIIFMLVLAYLSSRLGEALKIPSYYKILIYTAGFIIAALILDVLAATVAVPLFKQIALYIRFFSGFVACIVVFRYWKWVFSEFFKH